MSDTAAERYERIRHAILARLKVDIDHEWTALRDLFKRELARPEKAEAERDRLRRQLPEGMKHCTIQFKECEKGHGWLTAANWVEHGCPTCAVEKGQARIAELNAFIVKLSREMPYWDEVRQLDGQVRTLIAEVGTLRAQLAEMKRRAPSFFGDLT
jgi:hypothetical protein